MLIIAVTNRMQIMGYKNHREKTDSEGVGVFVNIESDCDAEIVTVGMGSVPIAVIGVDEDGGFVKVMMGKASVLVTVCVGNIYVAVTVCGLEIGVIVLVSIGLVGVLVRVVVTLIGVFVPVEVWAWTVFVSVTAESGGVLVGVNVVAGIASSTNTQSSSPVLFVPGGVNFCMPVFANGELGRAVNDPFVGSNQ